MTSYRYIGYGVTDSNGVAHLDHDPQGNPINGYTGTGAGEVDVIASLDKPITDDSIVSETLSVYDAWMRDGGITGDVNNEDWVVQSGGSRTVQSDGTVFSADSATTYLFAWINKHGTTHTTLDTIAEFGGDYAIELTVVDITGTVNFYIYEKYPSSERVAVPLSVGKWLFKRINNVVTAFKDGVAYPISSQSLTAPQRIGLGSYGGSVKLRDICVYNLGGTELGLTASKQVIEIEDTTVLSAYLSEGSGETVQLYNADTDTLIDTMTDVGNGNYIYSITGTGSGQKRYYAKRGTIVSETYDVLDCQYIDYAISDNHQTWRNESASTFSRNNTGTTITASSSLFPRIEKTISGDFEALFNASMTNTIRLALYDKTNGSNQITWAMNQSNEVLFRIRRVGTTITVQHSTDNGTTWSNAYTKESGTITNEDVYLGFVISTTNERSITFHDLKVYPI